MHEPGSMDISQHKSMYGAFMGMTKFGIISMIILLALLGIFVA